MILGLTSAHTVILAAILPAFGCAPDIPPNLLVTNKAPFGGIYFSKGIENLGAVNNPLWTNVHVASAVIFRIVLRQGH